MIKSLYKLAIIIGILTLITNMLPNPITSNINGAFIYFLGTTWALNGLFNVATFLACFQLFANFAIGLMSIYLMLAFIDSGD